jgi:hypothetical protein
MSLEEYFSTGPPFERPVFEAVHSFLCELGPIHVEAVQVGIFLKKAGTFVELRTMTRWVACSFGLSRRLEHPKLSRKPAAAGARWWHWVNLAAPEDLDATLKDWLAESYAETP